MAGQITNLSMEDPKVALIIAAHNAAMEYKPETPTEANAARVYAETFTRIYQQLAAAAELETDDDDDDD